MAMREKYGTGFALGYLVLGIIIILMKDSAWEVFLAFGLLGIGLLEYTGGEDGNRNWLFMILFFILGVAVLFNSSYQYWVLIFTFIIWGAYEIVEERILNQKRWDLIGVSSLLIGGVLLLTGLMDYTYAGYLAMAFGIMFAVQGLKEWFD